jgi:hypothetical protein
MRLHRIAAGLLCALLWTSAAAAPITFEFVVEWAAGPLEGSTDRGIVSADGDDCPGGVCTGVFSPADPAGTLLELTIEVDGRVYDIAADLGFPTFPQVTFSGLGAITNIDYEGLVSERQLVLSGGVATYFPPSFPGGPDRSFGFFRQVSEPGSLALLGSALFLAPWLRRRVGGQAAV